MVLPRPISVPPLRFGVLQGGVLMLCVALLLVGCGRKIREIIKKYRKSQPRLTASSTSEAQCTNQRALMACEYVGGYLVSLIRVERRTGTFGVVDGGARDFCLAAAATADTFGAGFPR